MLIDYIRTSVVRGGGNSHMKKVASFAEIYQVKTGFHGATDIYPVTMAAALHLEISISNYGIQECMPHSEETEEVCPQAYGLDEGFVGTGGAAGLGVDIDRQQRK